MPYLIPLWKDVKNWLQVTPTAGEFERRFHPGAADRCR